MLTIEPPLYQVQGITIFRDHEDPDLFYYLPGTPAIAPAGEGVSFTLYKYRRDLTDNPAFDDGAPGRLTALSAPNPSLDPTQRRGAGLAFLETEIPAPNLTRLALEVASQSGRPDARLVPVVFTAATVRAIVARAEGDRLIDDLVEVHDAPLVSPHHAAFALALSAEGATLFEAAAKSGSLPVGVAYELRFLALTPSLHAKVRMHYDRIYDHFSAALGFDYVVSVKLDLDLAWLVEHDLITIEITSFTDGEDAERQRKQVMDLVSARIKGDFFRSGLLPEAPDSPMAGPLAHMLGGLIGGDRVTSASALFVLKAKYEVVKEHKELQLHYDGRTAIPLTHAVSGRLATMIEGGPPPDVREIDLDDPFFSTLRVRVGSVIDFDALADLSEAIVTIARGDHRASFAFSRTDPGPFRFELPLTDPADDEYRYDVEYLFDPERGLGPPRLAAGPFTARKRALTLSPLAHFAYRRVRFLLGPLDPARVPRVEVTARVPPPDTTPDADDLARDRFTLDAQQPERVFRVRFPLDSGPIRVLVRSSWEDADGSLHESEEGEIEVIGDTHVVRGPYRDALSLLIQPAADWTKVTQVLVQVRHEERDDVTDHTLTFTPAGGAAGQRLEIPLRDPRHRAYRYRQTIFRADGTTEEIPWADADQGVLVIGKGRPTTADVRIVWLGAPGDAFGLRVDLIVTLASGEEQTVSAFLRAGPAPEEIVPVPLDRDGRLAYRYEVRAVTADGETLIRSGEDHSALLVVQSGRG